MNNDLNIANEAVQNLNYNLYFKDDELTEITEKCAKLHDEISQYKATIIELNSELSKAQLHAQHIEKKTSTSDEVVDSLNKTIIECNATIENLKLERANDLSALEQKCVEVTVLRYELDNLNGELLKKDEEYLQLASKVVASEASTQELTEKVENIEQG